MTTIAKEIEPEYRSVRAMCSTGGEKVGKE